MLERLSADATKAVFLSQEEARRLGHNYVDTEILMLGLLALAAGTSAGSSEPLASSLKATRKAIESVIGRGSDFVSRDPPFTATVDKVLETTLKQAPRGTFVNTEQILRRLLCEVDCDAVRVLQSLSLDTELMAVSLNQLAADTKAADDDAELDEDAHVADLWEEEGRAYSREQALWNVFGLNNFIKEDLVPAGMLDWFDEKDEVFGVYVNAEDDLIVVGERGICWYDGQAKTFIEYKSIDSVEGPASADDPYLKLVLRPKGKVVMLPVLHATEAYPDYFEVFDYLSFCTKPKVRKMDIQDIQSKDDLVYFLRQPSVQSAGFDQLASWLESGSPAPSWLGPLNIKPEVLNDPSVWRLFALILLRVPNAAGND